MAALREVQWRRRIAEKRTGRLIGGPLRPEERCRERLARLAQTCEDALGGYLPRDELGTPRLSAQQGLVEATIVGADGQEPDDDHAKSDTRKKADDEGFHLFSLGRPTVAVPLER